MVKNNRAHVVYIRLKIVSKFKAVDRRSSTQPSTPTAQHKVPAATHRAQRLWLRREAVAANARYTQSAAARRRHTAPLLLLTIICSI